MRKSTAALLVLLLVLPAIAGDKQELPKLITNARYVMVTTYFGDDPTRVSAEERHAVSDVQDAIRKWGRYSLVYRRDQADLLLVLRKGRLGSVGVGRTVATASPRRGGITSPPSGAGTTITAEGGDPQDTLTLYDARMGVDSASLWRGRMRDGLSPPALRLFEQLRKEVEQSGKP